jgi:hypothetical protein
MTPNQISPLDIVTHTPLWVWALLAYSLYVGWRMTRDRILAPWRVFIMPAIAAAFALANLLTDGATPTALSGFAAGGALGATAGVAIARRRPARLRDDGRLAVPGDWLPLALLIGIFAVRYARGVAIAIDPQIAADPLSVFAGMVASGLFAATMIARVLAALPSEHFRRTAGRSSAEKNTAPG